MGHDETITGAMIGQRQMSGITVYAIYGLRLADDTDWYALEEDPGHCLNNGTVGYFRVGAHKKRMTFLATQWAPVEPGKYVYHSGEKPNAHKFERDRWNSDLRAVADRLGLDVVEEPGWYTIPNES